MEATRLIFSILVALCAVYIVAVNWGCIIVSSINQRKGIDRHHSTVPFISLILAGFAATLYPYEQKAWFLLIAAVDLSNWTLLLLPYILIKECMDTKKPNKAADSTTARVTPPASSPRPGQESRHRQP